MFPLSSTPSLFSVSGKVRPAVKWFEVVKAGATPEAYCQLLRVAAAEWLKAMASKSIATAYQRHTRACTFAPSLDL